MENILDTSELTDREILLMIYGALKHEGHSSTRWLPIVDIIEKQLFPQAQPTTPTGARDE